VELFADGTSVATSGTEVSPNVYRFLWNSRDALDGTHQLTARAKDETGNVGSAPAVSVEVKNAVDTTPPVVTLLSPAENATLSGSATLEANASDTGGIASLTISAPGASCSSVTTKVSCTWSLKNVASGWYTVTARATDKAGLSATDTASVYVKATTITTTRTKPIKR
jgi:thermitase